MLKRLAIILGVVVVALGVGVYGLAQGWFGTYQDAGTIEGTQVRDEELAARVAGSSDPEPQVSRAKQILFGDLHVHTTLSFDAQAFDVQTTPAAAYDFAKGAPVALPPLDINGDGTQVIQLERPLDFAAVTDHSEYLGEVEECTTPGSPRLMQTNAIPP